MQPAQINLSWLKVEFDSVCEVRRLNRALVNVHALDPDDLYKLKKVLDHFSFSFVYQCYLLSATILDLTILLYFLSQRKSHWN